MSMLCAITSLMNIPQNSLSFVNLSANGSVSQSLAHNESVNDFTQLCILLLHPGNNQQLDHLDLNEIFLNLPLQVFNSLLLITL